MLLLIFLGTQEFTWAGMMERYKNSALMFLNSACLTGSHWQARALRDTRPFVCLEREWSWRPRTNILNTHISWAADKYSCPPPPSPPSLPSLPLPPFRFHHGYTWANASRWNRQWRDKNKTKTKKNVKKWKTLKRSTLRKKSINGIQGRCKVLWGKQNIRVQPHCEGPLRGGGEGAGWVLL